MSKNRAPTLTELKCQLSRYHITFANGRCGSSWGIVLLAEDTLANRRALAAALKELEKGR